jgi:hypothetical protein
MGEGEGLGDADGLGVGDGEGSTPLLCSASTNVPSPDPEFHAVASSTDVPSPHSLKVVTSCQGAPDATMSRTFWFQVVASRARRGAVSDFFQKPGLMLKL